MPKTHNIMHNELSPFLKWAGGKRWLMSNYSELFPKRYNRYIEPFLGSGAAFFHINPNKAILSDRNCELINTYRAIKNDWLKVTKELQKHHLRHNEEYYYRIRSSNPRTPHTRAAKFIYLNRTCWNGLYRVNKSGEFNVPIGSKTKVVLESDNFERVSTRLNEVKLLDGDFEKIIDMAKKDDLLFIDPPYTVKHNLNGFIKYNEKIFSWDDQVRLRDSVFSAIDRGAKVVMTNANHKSIRLLYKDMNDIQKKQRNSMLAADPYHRKSTTELVIRGNIN